MQNDDNKQSDDDDDDDADEWNVTRKYIVDDYVVLFYHRSFFSQRIFCRFVGISVCALEKNAS